MQPKTKVQLHFFVNVDFRVFFSHFFRSLVRERWKPILYGFSSCARRFSHHKSNNITYTRNKFWSTHYFMCAFGCQFSNCFLCITKHTRTDTLLILARFPSNSCTFSACTFVPLLISFSFPFALLRNNSAQNGWISPTFLLDWQEVELHFYKK